MRGNVVEVKPVRLEEKELTGTPAPLRGARFFEQPFSELGAVAWPGEIDLAPHAMYAEVASANRDTPH
jgi:hypothetical protein